MTTEISFDSVASGFPYHAALIQLAASSGGSPGHGHADYTEFVFVVNGSVRHCVNGMEQRLSRGDLVLVRMSDVHAFVLDYGSSVEFINVALPMGTWRSLALASGLPADLFDHNVAPPIVGLTRDGLARTETAFRGVLENFHEGPHGLALTQFWAIAVEALVERDGANDDRTIPPWLVDACQAMSDERNLRGGVSRLAALAAVSRGHLARTTRAHFGQSPVEYVSELRLTRAATLLTSTIDPVGTIAKRCGFSSTSYFSRQFTQKYGISPRAYRQRRQQESSRLLWPMTN